MSSNRHAGTLPVPAQQLPSGTILVSPPAQETGTTVVYCRVSSHDQKADLERQAGRVLTLCSERAIRIDRTVTEIGSGLNGRRTKLRKLLADPKVSTIVVEHRDRLARFGVEYLESACRRTAEPWWYSTTRSCPTTCPRPH